MYNGDLSQAKNHQPTADKVFAYLGLERRQVQTPLIRTSSDHLADQLQNYEAINKALIYTKYAHYLGA